MQTSVNNNSNFIVDIPLTVPAKTKTFGIGSLALRTNYTVGDFNNVYVVNTGANLDSFNYLRIPTSLTVNSNNPKGGTLTLVSKEVFVLENGKTITFATDSFQNGNAVNISTTSYTSPCYLTIPPNLKIKTVRWVIEFTWESWTGLISNVGFTFSIDSFINYSPIIMRSSNGESSYLNKNAMLTYY